jgi:hypothetical protein
MAWKLLQNVVLYLSKLLQCWTSVPILTHALVSHLADKLARILVARIFRHSRHVAVSAVKGLANDSTNGPQIALHSQERIESVRFRSSEPRRSSDRSDLDDIVKRRHAVHVTVVSKLESLLPVNQVCHDVQVLYVSVTPSIL